MRKAPTVNGGDISIATAGGAREAQIKAASTAIALIAEQVGMRVAVVLLYAAYEECATRLGKDDTNGG
jgi:hypothetical protein